MHRPAHFDPANAETFEDRGVAAAYRHRPPYPAEVFEILAELVAGTPRRVLDAGCGTGDLARPLARHVARLDAVDPSAAMIAEGKRLPGGDGAGLRWLQGRVEEVALDPPYGPVTAGESLHWLEWEVALPRFRATLAPGAFLAIVGRETTPDPWSALGELIPRYRTDGGYQPFAMLDELARHGLFRRVGEWRTAPVPFVQSVDDFIESYHSRSGFSRARMGAERSAPFDREAREFLSRSHRDGTVTLQVVGSVLWGLPGVGLAGDR